MLEFHGVSKSYGRTRAIRPLDLAISSARTTVLIGPSGCGKSTLLRLMVGLLRPDTGHVLLRGEEVAAPRLRAMRHRMGYVIQDGGLFPHLTARGNVLLLPRHLGWSAEQCEERLRLLSGLTRFPLEALGRYPGQLSGGQRQRVSLMRALVLDPELLLLDEPLGALDPIVRFELEADLRSIFRELGKTVVLVTHDLAQAAYLGDRLVLLNEGSIVQSGTLEELVRSPAEPFVTRFINAQRSPLGDLPAPPPVSVQDPAAGGE